MIFNYYHYQYHHHCYFSYYCCCCLYIYLYTYIFILIFISIIVTTWSVGKCTLSMSTSKTKALTLSWKAAALCMVWGRGRHSCATACCTTAWTICRASPYATWHDSPGLETPSAFYVNPGLSNLIHCVKATDRNFPWKGGGWGEGQEASPPVDTTCLWRWCKLVQMQQAPGLSDDLCCMSAVEDCRFHYGLRYLEYSAVWQSALFVSNSSLPDEAFSKKGLAGKQATAGRGVNLQRDLHQVLPVRAA